MAKYVISYRAPEDYVPGREDDMAAWAAWFTSIGEDLADFGSAVRDTIQIGECGAGQRLRGYSVIPSPQKVELQGGEIEFNDSWSIEAGRLAKDHIAVRALVKDLREFHGIELNQATAKTGKLIRLSVMKGAVKTGAAEEIDTQGYLLKIAPGLIGLLLIGIVLSYAFVRSGTLYLSIGLHAGWVIAIKTVRVFGDYRAEDLGWLFGSSDPKIVSGVVTWVGIILVGVAVHWFTRNRAGLRVPNKTGKAIAARQVADA